MLLGEMYVKDAAGALPPGQRLSSERGVMTPGGCWPALGRNSTCSTGSTVIAPAKSVPVFATSLERCHLVPRPLLMTFATALSPQQ